MILKGKIFASNCDSTRNLSTAEIQHRLLVSILFADGIICSPNLLIDNLDAISLLKNRILNKWFNEEGHGSIIIRSPFALQDPSLNNYVQSLPGDHYFHSFKCHKKDLTDDQLSHLLRSTEAFDHKVAQYGIQFERANVQTTSLQSAIKKTLQDEIHVPEYEALNRALYHGDFDASQLISRSHWYNYINDSIEDPLIARKIKLEIVDSNYNKLFVNDGESYAMDRIAHLSLLPTKVLSFGVAIKTFKQEYDNIRTIMHAFEVISSFGTLDLTKILTDVALNVIEDVAEDNGLKWATRKNWFGLYNMLTQKIGIEIK